MKSQIHLDVFEGKDVRVLNKAVCSLDKREGNNYSVKSICAWSQQGGAGQVKPQPLNVITQISPQTSCSISNTEASQVLTGLLSKFGQFDDRGGDLFGGRGVADGNAVQTAQIGVDFFNCS